jgi:hypothetical protein
MRSAVPSGRLPDGAGKLPALPIFQTASYGEERWASEVERVERVVREELCRAGWDEARLGSTAKGPPVKVRAALRRRRETTVTYGWIAERLQMGSRSNVSNLVYGRH